MQVFTAFPDLNKSVCCLDPSRLGNQIYREAKTLMMDGWPNHPASKMWKNYKIALAQYCLFGLEELERRGRKYPAHKEFFLNIFNSGKLVMPPFIGNEDFHKSHRRALLTKNFEWYKNYFPEDKPFAENELIKKGKLVRLPYVWPKYA